MKTKVLVAFASTSGATEEIAAAIADTLREHGLTVDLQAAREVKTLEGYSAVVLGAPLYMFRWHKDALNFLSRQQAALQQRQIAIFAGGPIETGGANELPEIRKQLDKELAKYPWLAPLDIQIVGGRFDATRLRFPYNLIPAMRNRPPSDLRDWTAIRAWAEELAIRLQSISS